jgi:nitrate/TMAO reductase-like tetraheme cytochrome c subunit
MNIKIIVSLIFANFIAWSHAYGVTNAECIKCHEDQNFYMKFNNVKRQGMYISAQTIETSVHKNITCTQCHSNITSYPHAATVSISKIDVPSMCAKCHYDVYKKYTESIHWQAIKKGINAAPVCTDCHGVHDILKPTNPEAKVYPENIPKTCSNCHDSVKLAQEYNLPLNRLTTYENSFHGIALKFGDLRAANCASCHGVHDILPSDNPHSSINKANLAKTCGKCHPNATENFIKSPIHVTVSKHGERGPYIVRVFYTWFIGTLITIFIIYVFFDLINNYRRKKTQR